MISKNICNYCARRFPTDQLYLLKEGNWSASKACGNCLHKIPEKNIPSPLITVEQYILRKENKPIIKPISKESSTHSVQGHAVINNQPYQVTLEETTTVTRRIIINPNNQS